MAPADHRIDLIRLRAKRVARCERDLKYTRDAYRDALGRVAESLAEYELGDLGPDQDPADVLADIRRLAQRRADLERRKATDVEARGKALEAARKRLDAAIFDEQLELFAALDDDRKAATEPEPERLKVDDAGNLVPYLDPQVEAQAKPSRGRRATA